MSRLQLEIATPAGGSTTLALDKPQYTIGRDPAAEICLDDPRASRQHARLTAAQDGYVLTDAGSSNGVLVDDQVLRGGIALKVGMRIVLGGSTLTVRLAAASHVPSASATPAAAAALPPANEPPRTSRYVLVAINGPRPGSSFALPFGAVGVGRDSKNLLCVDDPSLSRQHARLDVEAGAVRVTDLQSSNGTFIDEIRCTSSEVLRPGSRLRLGQVAFDVVSAGDPAAVGPQPALLPRPRPGQWLAWVALAVLSFGLTFFGLRQRLGPSPDWRSPAERAEQAQLQEWMLAGEEGRKSGDWGSSIAAYRQALRLDPVNAQARAGLAEGETQRQAAQILLRAKQAMKQGMPLQALNLAAAFPASELTPPISEFFAQASRTAASQTLQSADVACRALKWAACQLHAATLLVYLPQEPWAQALVQEAENGLSTAGRPYHHVGLPCGQPWRQIPQPEVRDATLRYATGDADTAARRLQTFRGFPGAAAAAARLQALRVAWAAGEAARTRGNLTAAMGYYARGTELDAQLMGRSPCSVWGSRLRARLGAGRQHAGQQAFDRGQYGQAFAEWTRAQRVLPDSAEVAASLQRLEERAASLLGDLSTLPAMDLTACTRLQTVLEMTFSNSSAHRAALAKLKECRNLTDVGE